jgi:hypothetical protein
VKHLNPHNFVVLNGFNVSVNITESYCLLNFLLIAQKSRQTLYQFQLYVVVPIENFLKWQEILNILLAVLKAVVRCHVFILKKYENNVFVKLVQNQNRLQVGSTECKIR